MGTKALKSKHISYTIAKPQIYTTRTPPKINHTDIYLQKPRKRKSQKKAKIETKTKANTHSQTQNQNQGPT